MNPIEWAKKAVIVHRAQKAYEIATYSGREFIGVQNDEPNPYRVFYSNAAGYIKNRHKIE